MALLRSVVPPLAPNQYLGWAFEVRFIRWRAAPKHGPVAQTAWPAWFALASASDILIAQGVTMFDPQDQSSECHHHYCRNQGLGRNLQPRLMTLQKPRLERAIEAPLLVSLVSVAVSPGSIVDLMSRAMERAVILGQPSEWRRRLLWGECFSRPRG